MTVLITLSGVGSSAGPTFDLYASPDGITFTLFAPGINKTALEPGYTATVPNGTTKIKVSSVGACTNSYVATIGVIPTTTTTTTIVTIPTVAICGQSWASVNLNVDRYANGEIIPQSTTIADWLAKAATETGAWCYYDFNPANEAVYGKLYNWFAVNDPRGLAPTGYHIASLSEWSNLHTCLGGNDLAGGKMKEPGTTHWSSPNPVLTPYTGMATLPGGLISATSGESFNLHDYGTWWTSTETDNLTSYAIAHESTSTYSFITGFENGAGLSVRVILGNLTTTTTTTNNTITTTTTTTAIPTTTTTTTLQVFGHDIDQSFAYCVEGFCELDAPVTNVLLYSLDETLVTGSYVYTDPELQYIYTTNAIVSNGQYLFNVSSIGRLSMTCTVGIEC